MASLHLVSPFLEKQSCANFADTLMHPETQDLSRGRARVHCKLRRIWIATQVPAAMQHLDLDAFGNNMRVHEPIVITRKMGKTSQ